MKNSLPSPSRLALRFVSVINAHDPVALAALMSRDHRFVDATGAVHAGRQRMLSGWTEYFAAFPDYRIEVDEVITAGSSVALFGWASGTYRGKGRRRKDAAWRIPAAWRATVARGRIRAWQVWCDVEPMLRSMGIARFG